MIGGSKKKFVNARRVGASAVDLGFHLAPQKEDYVRQTVTAPKETDPDYVIPMH